MKRAYMLKPAIVMISPCAKFTRPMTLNTMARPSARSAYSPPIEAAFRICWIT